MSTKILVTIMEKLLKLHQSLYELSVKKTDILIEGDMDALNQILKDEQAHIAAISKFEDERQKVVEAILPGVEKPTISDCVAAVDGAEKDFLDQLRTELMETVSNIKEKNELNQQMIHQSLQFVHLTMNLVTPQQVDFNYGPQAGNTSGQSSGLFNSKA
ncbi:MAG TPA: flagellar protein FlgN [Bacillales bacterium]|nr:flagellar protein FlgN [Bacillales bacterium]